MIANKKGLSTVVATLLIILLVIVAVGVIWTVIRGTIDSGTGQLDLGAKCVAVDVKATSARCDTTGVYRNCSVTLYRAAGGDDFNGVKLIFFNADGTASASIDRNESISELATVTSTNLNTTLANTTISKVQVVPYFNDESGNEQLCSTGATLSDVTNA